MHAALPYLGWRLAHFPLCNIYVSFSFLLNLALKWPHFAIVQCMSSCVWVHNFYNTMCQLENKKQHLSQIKVLKLYSLWILPFCPNGVKPSTTNHDIIEIFLLPSNLELVIIQSDLTSSKFHLIFLEHWLMIKCTNQLNRVIANPLIPR